MFTSFNPLTALLIFGAYLLVDAMYAYYTYSVIKRRPYTSATTGALMHFLLAFGILNYVRDPLYLIPLALGSWCGTFIAVRFEQKRNV